MRIFQAKFNLSECLLQKIACPHTRTCPLREKIKKIEAGVLKELNSITIASLLI
jgi:DNA-binding IscR family transcriptional regulator